MKDPIDLLKDRLNEINDIECDDLKFKRYRLKYVLSIQLLELNGFVEVKDGRRKLSDIDKKLLKDECERYQVDYYANLLQVCRATIEREMRYKRRKHKKIKIK